MVKLSCDAMNMRNYRHRRLPKIIYDSTLRNNTEYFHNGLTKHGQNSKHGQQQEGRLACGLALGDPVISGQNGN